MMHSCSAVHAQSVRSGAVRSQRIAVCNTHTHSLSHYQSRHQTHLPAVAITHLFSESVCLSVAMSKQCEGPLLVAIDNEWANLFCWVRDGKFQAFDRQKTVSTVNVTRVAVLDITLTPDTVYTAAWKPDIAALDNISRKPDINFPTSPYYFEITHEGVTYICATGHEKDSKRWLSAFGTVLMDILERKGRYGRKMDALKADFARTKSSIFNKNEVYEPEEISPEEKQRLKELQRLKDLSEDYNEEVHSNKTSLKRIKTAQKDLKKKEHQARLEAEDDDNYEEVYCCKEGSRFNIKLDTVIRLLKVLSAYPFVIVISTLNVANSHPIFRSNAFIRCMNFLIYFMPFLFGKLTLSFIYVILVVITDY